MKPIFLTTFCCTCENLVKTHVCVKEYHSLNLKFALQTSPEIKIMYTTVNCRI